MREGRKDRREDGRRRKGGRKKGRKAKEGKKEGEGREEGKGGGGRDVITSTRAGKRRRK